MAGGTRIVLDDVQFRQIVERSGIGDSTGVSPMIFGPSVSITAGVVSVTEVPRLPAISIAEKTGLTAPEDVAAVIEKMPW